jgi:hypothetical protein
MNNILKDKISKTPMDKNAHAKNDHWSYTKNAYATFVVYECFMDDYMVRTWILQN